MAFGRMGFHFYELANLSVLIGVTWRWFATNLGDVVPRSKVQAEGGLPTEYSKPAHIGQ